MSTLMSCPLLSCHSADLPGEAHDAVTLESLLLDLCLSPSTIWSATTCLERSRKLQLTHYYVHRKIKLYFPLWLSSFPWWEQGWRHPHHGNIHTLGVSRLMTDSAPTRAVRRMKQLTRSLSFLPPARRAVIWGCGNIRTSHTHGQVEFSSLRQQKHYYSHKETNRKELK